MRLSLKSRTPFSLQGDPSSSGPPLGPPLGIPPGGIAKGWECAEGDRDTLPGIPLVIPLGIFLVLSLLVYWVTCHALLSTTVVPHCLSAIASGITSGIKVVGGGGVVVFLLVLYFGRIEASGVASSVRGKFGRGSHAGLLLRLHLRVYGYARGVVLRGVYHRVLRASWEYRMLRGSVSNVRRASVLLRGLSTRVGGGGYAWCDVPRTPAWCGCSVDTAAFRPSQGSMVFYRFPPLLAGGYSGGATPSPACATTPLTVLYIGGGTSNFSAWSNGPRWLYVAVRVFLGTRYYVSSRAIAELRSMLSRVEATSGEAGGVGVRGCSLALATPVPLCSRVFRDIRASGVTVVAVDFVGQT